MVGFFIGEEKPGSKLASSLFSVERSKTLRPPRSACAQPDRCFHASSRKAGTLANNQLQEIRTGWTIGVKSFPLINLLQLFQ
ncbi:MAG: hypothetical protein Q7J76_06385 [Candidatus Brocadiaceae bacterium]|nr:hypothetical protein [Candidatus Brocadiaceae bacterium]